MLKVVKKDWESQKIRVFCEALKPEAISIKSYKHDCLDMRRTRTSATSWLKWAGDKAKGPRGLSPTHKGY